MITIQINSSTSMISLNMHECDYEYLEKNVLECDCFTIYSSTSTITLGCNHDYFHYTLMNNLFPGLAHFREKLVLDRE